MKVKNVLKSLGKKISDKSKGVIRELEYRKTPEYKKKELTRINLETQLLKAKRKAEQQKRLLEKERGYNQWGGWQRGKGF